MTIALWCVAAVASLALLHGLRLRLDLARAKHPSLAGHARLARRIASLIRHYEYDEAEFFRADDAPVEVASARRAGFERLAALFTARAPLTLHQTRAAEDGISDAQFTSRYRVPFQFSRVVCERLKIGAFAQATHGVTTIDLDGNEYYDLTGSYGVNVLGIEAYKDCIERGVEHVRALGPVLGPYHPLVASNVERLRRISGLDEVSFHMSGTEAVMQAVRLARYHTRRTHLVRFCGAYHGWWGEVQPGVGNPMVERATYTLKDMDPASLRVLRRRRDIACVLVNPVQAMHPNAGAPGDSTLLDSSRRAHVDRAAYAGWLRQLREVCSARGIVLIFDEVFVGFRLARGGAQEYFGVRADLVTYGKTLGGGLPVGVVCGRKELMRRFRPDRPVDVCVARGTFNSHPYVMGAMHEFLERFDSAPVRALYDDHDARWNARAQALNRGLEAAELPLRVANLSTIWTFCYTQPSRYNWMLQFYLRAEGLALSWVGSGRIIFSLDYGDEQFEEVARRIVDAARAMHQDGWWWTAPGLTDRAIRRRVLRETIRHWLARPAAAPPPRQKHA
jgi:glutamate-1-semialdehyde 2,1-aminomutase